MPIFASRLTPGQGLGEGLQRVRLRADGGDRARRTTGEDGEEGRVQGSQRDGAAALRTLVQLLPSSTQLAELLRARLLEEDSEAEEGREPTTPGGETGATTTPTRTPGVRRPGEDRAAQVGTLTPEATNPFLRQTPTGAAATLARARLKVAPTPPASLDAAAELREIPTLRDPEAPGLDRVADAQIRLLAAREQAQPPAVEPPQQEVAPQTPSAEQIAQANTTPEIRENLQANTQQIGQWLTQEATASAQQNAARAQQNAEGAASSRQEREVTSNRRVVQDLRTEERRLERELAETEREIRSRENRSSQLQSGVTGALADIVAARLNIVAV